MKVPDERWVVVLEALQQRKDPRELITVMVTGAAAPIWVRARLKFWLKGKLPPELPLSKSDIRLLEVYDAFHADRRRFGERRADQIERAITKTGGGVKISSANNLLNCEGRTYERLRPLLSRRPSV